MGALLVIVNRLAGSVDDDAERVAVGALRERAGQTTGVEVAAVGGADELRDALTGHPEHRPVIVGGDGSVHAVVTALRDLDRLGDAVVGLIPLGTGNDFARTLDLPLDPVGAAGVVVDGEPRSVDLLVDDSGGVVVNSVHAGVGAEAGQLATPLKGVLGRVAYPVGALRAGLRARGWRLRVTVDGRIVTDGRRRVLMVGVGNGVTIAGGTPLTPHARPDDGLADVVVSMSTGPLARVLYGLSMGMGRHPRRDDVLYTRGGTVEVTGEPFPVNADGELRAEPVSTRTWTVEPAAVSFTVPRRGT